VRSTQNWLRETLKFSPNQSVNSERRGVGDLKFMARIVPASAVELPRRIDGTRPG